jgi:hypothetical protein
MRMRLLVITLILLLTSPAVVAGLEVDYDPSIDFSKYRTYAWQKGTAASAPKTQEMIVNTIERELQAKGLRPAFGAEADLYVVSVAFPDITGGLVGGYDYSPTYDVGIIRVDVRAAIVGTLMVDLVDAQDETVIWRAMATEAIKSNRKNLEKKINKMVIKMFNKYPSN